MEDIVMECFELWRATSNRAALLSRLWPGLSGVQMRRLLALIKKAEAAEQHSFRIGQRVALRPPVAGQRFGTIEGYGAETLKVRCADGKLRMVSSLNLVPTT